MIGSIAAVTHNVFQQLLRYLLRRAPDCRLSMSGLRLLLTILIPYNRNHRYKLNKVAEGEVEAELPFITANMNHVGTVHACSMATIGEFTAGIAILHEFLDTPVLPLLSELSVDYKRTGNEKLLAVCSFDRTVMRSAVEKAFESGHAATYAMQTSLTNSSNEVVAVVSTLWSLKPWTKESQARAQRR